MMVGACAGGSDPTVCPSHHRIPGSPHGFPTAPQRAAPPLTTTGYHTTARSHARACLAALCHTPHSPRARLVCRSRAQDTESLLAALGEFTTAFVIEFTQPPTCAPPPPTTPAAAHAAEATAPPYVLNGEHCPPSPAPPFAPPPVPPYTPIASVGGDGDDVEIGLTSLDESGGGGLIVAAVAISALTCWCACVRSAHHKRTTRSLRRKAVTSGWIYLPPTRHRTLACVTGPPAQVSTHGCARPCCAPLPLPTACYSSPFAVAARRRRRRRSRAASACDRISTRRDCPRSETRC